MTRLHGATLQVVRGPGRARSLDVLVAGEAVGELSRDGRRVRLEVGDREWRVALRGLRVVRAVVSGPEGARLLVYAGGPQWGAAATRAGSTLTVDLGTRWKAFARLPGLVVDERDRSVLEIEPAWEAGPARWIVRTGRHPGAEADVPAALALWGALVLEARRAPWLRLTTAGLSPERVEEELAALAGESP